MSELVSVSKRSVLSALAMISIVFSLLLIAVSIEVLEMEEIAKVYVVPILLVSMFVSGGAIAAIAHSKL